MVTRGTENIATGGETSQLETVHHGGADDTLGAVAHGLIWRKTDVLSRIENHERPPT